MNLIIKSRIVQIFVFFVLLIIIHIYILKTSIFDKAKLSYSDFNSSIIRTQSVLYNKLDKNSAILIGSSLTGRLFEDYFTNEKYKFFNMGLDGCGTLFGLNLILKCNKDPRIILIEGNKIYADSPQNEQVIEDYVDSFTFKLAEKITFLRYENRPIDIMYSMLKLHRENKIQKNQYELNNISLNINDNPDINLEKYSGKKPLYIYHKVIKEIKKNVPRIIIYTLPSEEISDKDLKNFTRSLAYLAKIWDVELWDFRAKLKDKKLSFTDGIHLDKESSIFMCKLIEKQLNKEQN